MKRKKLIIGTISLALLLSIGGATGCDDDESSSNVKEEKNDSLSEDFSEDTLEESEQLQLEDENTIMGISGNTESPDVFDEQAFAEEANEDVSMSEYVEMTEERRIPLGASSRNVINYYKYAKSNGATYPEYLPCKYGTAHKGNFTYRLARKKDVTDRIYVLIEKEGGFKNPGRAYLKLGHPLGNKLIVREKSNGDLLDNIHFRAGTTCIVLEYKPVFDYGIEVVFPLIITDETEYRSYEPPFLCMGNKKWSKQIDGTQLSYGESYGTINGVDVVSNGNNYVPSNVKWDKCGNYAIHQCVELAKKYCNKLYQIGGNQCNTFYTLGNAVDWFGRGNDKFVSYSNGGTMPPMPGDFICWKGGSSGYGHIGVIVWVTKEKIFVAQQNAKTEPAIGLELSMNVSNGKYTVKSKYGSLELQGWMRPRDNY